MEKGASTVIIINFHWLHLKGQNSVLRTNLLSVSISLLYNLYIIFIFNEQTKIIITDNQLRKHSYFIMAFELSIKSRLLQ